MKLSMYAMNTIYPFSEIPSYSSIKETGTVGSRASCDLMADRRLCLTGTPVQNKLDDVFALIKFLRLDPFDDKNIWTEFIGSPVKFGQALGVARLQTIMKCITLRRTKETKTLDGQRILALPPRRDELRYLKFDAEEQAIYDQFFNESKAEFNEMSTKNEVMKNYVGILQKILRLRQICDHFELVQGKGLGQEGQLQDTAGSYEDIVAAISKDGINAVRAAAIFAILRESATTQCVECGGELCISTDPVGSDNMDIDGPSAPKRGRKTKAPASRGSTRASSPSTPRPILTRCQHLFCYDCYRNSICPGWPNVAPDTRRSCSACQTGLSPSDAVEIKPETPFDAAPKKKPQKREKRQKGGSLENFHPSTKVKALLGDLVQFSRTNRFSSNYDPASIEVQMIDDQGNQLDDGIVKTVVL
jgi:SWI/SNF-related matrix-associated actin-dependent regulator of chromatin subfamily A3